MKWSAIFRPRRQQPQPRENQSGQASAASATTPPTRQRPIYQPLPSQPSFRVLLLRPSHDPSALIDCEVVPFLLHSSPPYAALSYRWGDPEPSASIILNGTRFAVGPNLHSALRHVRLADKPALLWVDALCINQSDLDERSSQVTYMRRIYSDAARVIVWIGEADERSLRAEKFIDTFIQTAESSAELLNLPESERQYFLRDHFCTDEHVFDWQCILHLYRRPYWSRVWIIQEIACAKDIVILCGTQSFSHRKFTIFMLGFDIQTKFLNSAAANTIQPIFRQILTDIRGAISPIETVEAVRHLYRSRGPVHLGTLINLTHEFEASDPKDKIFALLGLAVEQVSRAITVDYRQSLAEIYTSATRFLLAEHSDISQSKWLAGRRPGSDQDDEFPSWVFDFRELKMLHALEPTEFGPTLGNEKPIYSAAGTDSWNGMEFSFKGKHIATIRGAIVDTIDLHDAWLGHNDPFRTRISRWKTMVGDYAEEEPYVGGGTKSEALWRTVLLDRIALYHLSYVLFRRLGSQINQSQIPPASVEEEESLIAFVENRGEILSRVFFISGRRYMGFAPPLARQGDLVCVLANAEKPYILRETEHGHYRLVGECYMHGIMDGQMANGGQYRDFMLV